MSDIDADERRSQLLDEWERAAPGWGRRGSRLRAFGMPVAAWLVEQLRLHPGQRVLELAAGPGDVGFLAAELVRPGGTLISSDGAQAMLEVARARAAEQGIENVEFRQLALEWIDLPTAGVDAIVCRWALMLCLDPAAALSEARRVLRPGGRIALAVWDQPHHNPWATIPRRALVELGHMQADPADGPGMFALAQPGRLRELLEAAGFVEVIVESVGVERVSSDVEEFVRETLDVSRMFGDVYERLSERERQEVLGRIAKLVEPHAGGEGVLKLPGRSLVAAASA